MLAFNDTFPKFDKSRAFPMTAVITMFADPQHHALFVDSYLLRICNVKSEG